jgi:hypothetical protein
MHFYTTGLTLWNCPQGNPPPHPAPWPLDPVETPEAVESATPPTSPGRPSVDGGSSILDSLYFDAAEDVDEGPPQPDSNDLLEPQLKAGAGKPYSLLYVIQKLRSSDGTGSCTCSDCNTPDHMGEPVSQVAIMRLLLVKKRWRACLILQHNAPLDT